MLHVLDVESPVQSDQPTMFFPPSLGSTVPCPLHIKKEKVNMETPKKLQKWSWKVLFPTRCWTILGNTPSRQNVPGMPGMGNMGGGCGNMGGCPGGGNCGSGGGGALKCWRTRHAFFDAKIYILIELDDGKFYRKPLYFMVKNMVSFRFSLKPIHWYTG